MYNEQLEKLIEMALMDGELTEKEKQILFKKAEGMGVDLDEFEMVLEAKLFEKQKSMEQEKPKTKEAVFQEDLLSKRRIYSHPILIFHNQIRQHSFCIKNPSLCSS